MFGGGACSREILSGGSSNPVTFSISQLNNVICVVLLHVAAIGCSGLAGVFAGRFAVARNDLPLMARGEAMPMIS